MSALKYYAFPGIGVQHRDAYHFSQAVRIGDRVECSGQVGWDTTTGALVSAQSSNNDVTAEIDQAFANVDLCLKDAGVSGGASQVYRVTSYHVGEIGEGVLEAMARNFRQYIPDQKPIWTCIGVERLALPGFNVEVEVVAYDPVQEKA